MDVMAGINLHGRTAIVTGGYSGLGLETVRALVSAGADVVVPARDRVKAEARLRGLERVEVVPLDLLEPQSIVDFVRWFVSSTRPLHLLVHCAGIMLTELRRDLRGLEYHFAVNHLGPFQLTIGLWPSLASAKGARIVTLSSRGHFASPVVFDDIHFERRGFEALSAYGQSKTANALFSLAADRRGEAQDIRAFSVHPGTILTELTRHVSHEVIRAFGVVDAAGNAVIDPVNDRKTVQQGAATGLWCATSPQLVGMGGVYCEDCDIAVDSEAETTVRRGVKPWAADVTLAESLWAISTQITGVGFE
jgi:NAD(P)-dependent dehydrogenase (short-subunit alcohol dehydrogenase family)